MWVNSWKLNKKRKKQHREKKLIERLNTWKQYQQDHPNRLANRCRLSVVIIDNPLGTQLNHNKVDDFILLMHQILIWMSRNRILFFGEGDTFFSLLPKQKNSKLCRFVVVSVQSILSVVLLLFDKLWDHFQKIFIFERKDIF